MQNTKKMIIRNKLVNLLKEVKQIKSQIIQISILQHKFRFESLLPKQLENRKKIQPANINKMAEQNKQNNSFQINQNANVKKMRNKSTKQFAHRKNYSDFMEQNDVDKVGIESIKEKNEKMKDLKVGLLLQLTEIKSMQKKQQALRRASQKMKAYNSQQKRYYTESLSKQKRKKLEAPNQSVEQDSLLNSNISIAIPITLQPHPIFPSPSFQPKSCTKILKCKKGHEFYEGYVNQKDKPHGNGRLEMCCQEISQQIGYQYVRDSQFYQGQFKNGLFHGFGTLSYRGGVKYVGEFRQGKRHGKGSMYYNGKAEIAKWENDVFIAIM